MNAATVVLAALAVLAGYTSAFPGEFVPKSNNVYLRKTFVELPQHGRRAKRSQSTEYGGASFGFDGTSAGGQLDAVKSGLDQTFNQLKGLARAASAGSGTGGGAASYSGSFGASSRGSAAGPVLHSRFAESNGGYERELVTGGDGNIRSYSSAKGPNGAISFSSSFTDGNGQVRYDSRARQF